MKPKQAEPPSVAPKAEAEPLDQDPEIEARVERATARYAAVLSPEDLGFMKEALRLYLAGHPDVAPLVDRLRPRADGASGERPRAGLDPEAQKPVVEQKVRRGAR